MEPSVQAPASWEIYPELSREMLLKAKQAGIEPVQAQLLSNRGLHTLEEMRAFLLSDYKKILDPRTLIDLPRALARIQQALAQQEHITVYGDYDADGVTSSALLFSTLRSLKAPEARLDFHIPHRLKDGCGLNIKALDKLKQRGTQLIITTDCASSDVEQVAYARELGIDVIITDHHHPPASPPDAFALVNPWRPDSTYGERYLCGVGVAFKLSQALYRAYKRPIDDELALLDLVAVGTVADIAPLLGENHTLVRLGMRRLNTTQRPGLKALIQAANLQPGRIRERDIAFGLAPRINAAGRMKEASIAFELLTTNDDEEARARVIELVQLNQNRQLETEELMRSVREQARHQEEKPVVVVSGEDWHEGVIGLVAGKLSEELHKPVVVLSQDKETALSRGSVRSQKGFNIIAALSSYADQLERYGGHKQAAGFTIRSERVAALQEHLVSWHDNEQDSEPQALEKTEQADNVVEPEGAEQAFQAPVPKIDLVFTKMERLNYALYQQLRALDPFGAGNPEPVFKMIGLRLLGTWTSGPNKQNLRLRLGSTTSNMQLMGTFTRGAARADALKGVQHVTVIFKLDANEDENKQEVWMKILDVEPCQ